MFVFVARQDILQRRAGNTRITTKLEKLVAREVIDAAEIQAHSCRPDHRRAFELQLVGNFIEQFQRVARLAVHLVDKGHDRDVAQPADFEQLARLAFDAARRVDHHNSGICGGQRAIGVLAEILVARRVEQVENRAAILERHHRTRDRDAAFLLDLHPVRPRAPGLAAGLHLPRRPDRAA